MHQLPVIVKRTALPIDFNEGTYYFDPSDERWKPYRSVPYDYGVIRNFFRRLKLAYGVFTGRYDCLDWS
jgi:hypothetical protein